MSGWVADAFVGVGTARKACRSVVRLLGKRSQLASSSQHSSVGGRGTITTTRRDGMETLQDDLASDEERVC